LQDNAGLTPLHYAASCGHGAVVQFLLAHGADPTVKDEDGETPADAAENDPIRTLIAAALASRAATSTA
jgi:ankyrin repeat protein